MFNVVFLILNYNSIVELKECIKSIRNFCNNYYIVVVDNASKKDEIEELEKMCETAEDIRLLKSSNNLGFAKGNNLGFRYIRKNINTKYIAMINSDTILLNENFYSDLEDAYEKYNFAVLGPDILPSKSNPMINELDTKEKVEKEIKKIKRIIKIMKIPFINIGYLVFNKIRYKILARIRKEYSQPIVDCELHGCFWVFSDKYILDGICDDTFLYGEENILLKDCRDNNLTTVFYPKIKIQHNESKSTKNEIPKLIKRKLFFYRNMLDSLYILLKKYN